MINFMTYFILYYVLMLLIYVLYSINMNKKMKKKWKTLFLTHISITENLGEARFLIIIPKVNCIS